ncbi:YadA-like family protein [Jonquetella sp. BV3C21]|uniref:YadA-like family protein n=1 Tax=Jonquetella sp. BV3C21 TaxID=1111126 RepID=UPI002101A1FE|nr:YadA-like family protein [Jonquetella sp. BV3C21]
MGFGSNIDTGYNNIAIGVNATISRGVQHTTANAIALGASSLVTAGGDMAVGRAAQALSDNAVAIGTMATASGKNSFALGSSSQAMGEMSFASGFGSKASGTSSFASGYYAQANGNSSVAVGGLSVAGQQYGTDFSTAIGYNAQALAMGSVAIGYNSMVSASVNNSLAIGSGTVLSTPVADGQYEAFTHQKLNDTTNGMLAIANEGTPRRIIGVAGGVNATDAVNVRQLQYVNNNLAKSIGGALYTGYASDNTTYQAPDFVIGAATYHTVKEAVEAAQNRYFSVSSTNKTDGSNYNNNGASGVDSVAIGPSAQTKNADNALAIGSGASVTVSGGVALGSGSVASDASGVGSAAYLGSAANVAATAKGTAGVLSVGSSAATRQIVNVAAGSRDTDAVNVAQLKAAGVNVAGGSNVVSVSPSSDPKTGATTYTVNVDLSNYAQTNGSNITNPATWAGKLGTGTINGTTDGGLVTGTTVKGALAPYAKTEALTKVAAGTNVSVNPSKDGSTGSTTYTVSVDLSNYAQTNGSNVTNPATWAGKLGTGTINGTTDGGLVTGTTVKGALAPYAKTAALPKVAVTGAPLMMKTDTDAAGSTTYTVGIDLSNYAQTNGNNITDPTAWAGKLGSGTIGGTTDGNLVTGTTVKNYVDGRRTQVSSADSRVVVTDEPIGTGGTMYKVALKTDQFKIKYSGDGDTTGENALDDRTAFVGTPNQISTVAENGKVTFKLDDVVTIGGSGGHPVTVNGTEGNIIGLTNTGWNTDNPVIVSGRAATEDQLSAVNEKVKQAAVAASGKIAFSGTTGKADVGLGEGLTITGDLAANADASSDNLRASVTGSTLKIEMSTAPTFKSVNAETLHADNKVTVGSAGAPTTTITPAGVDTNKLTVGTVTIDKTTNKITGLPADAGTGESEAVSGKYLKDQLKTVSDTVAASSNLSYAGDSGNGKVNLSTGTLSVKGDDKNIATVADAVGNVTVSLKDKITLGAAGTGIVLDGGHASAEFGPSIKINESGNGRISGLHPAIENGQAVTYEQLERVAASFGAKSTITADGKFVRPTYLVSATTSASRVYHSVGEALTAIDRGTVGSLVAVEKDSGDGTRLVYLENVGPAEDKTGFFRRTDLVDKNSGKLLQPKEITANPLSLDKISYALANPATGTTGTPVKIQNVAAGTLEDDAVNVSQLKKLGLDPNAAAPAVTYDNDQKKTVTLGDTVHNKYDPTNNPTGGVTITNVAEGVNPGDAVNMHQLKVVSDKVDAGWNLQDGAAASAAKKIASGDTVKVVGDKNISTALSGGGETKTLQITLSDSPVFGLVKINDGGRISGLLPGKADTEAATVYQIKKILTSLGGDMTLDENNGDIKLPQYELPGRTYNNIGSIAIAAKTGTMGTTVFTDADGKRIVWLRDPALNHTNTYNKAGYYRLEDVAENGISLKDTITDPDAHLVPTGQIRLSLTGPTDINRVLLDEDVVLGHVAAGTKDNDAVNVSQLKDVKKSIDKAKTDGLTFNGNKASYGAAGSSTTGAVALGSTVDVVASDPKNNATYSTDNLTVVAGKDASGAPVLTIKMADSPTFKALTAETVTAGGTSISNSGLSVGGKTYVSPIGLNANGNPIKNVGDAAEDGDAVNKKQLDALGGSTITVKAFDKADGDKGSYSFALSSNGQVGLKALDDNLVLSADKATNTLGLKLAETVTVGTAKPVTINGTDGSVKVGTTVLDGSQITGLTNTTWNGSPTSGRAATEDQLKAVADAASTASGELKDSGLTFTGNDSSTTGVVKLGNTLAVTADGTTGGTYTSANLKVTATEANGTNPAGLKISMTNSPVFTTVTAGNTSISDAGLTVGGKPYVTPTGLNANSKKITNVAEGTEEGDAVNFKQFDELANKKIAFMALDQNGKPIGEKYEFALKDGGTIKLLSDENFAVTADATHQALGVKLRDTVKIGAANPVTVNGAEGFVTGLTNTAWNGTATTGRAATEDQLKAVAVAASGELKDSGLTFIGNTGTTNLVKLGSTLAIKAGDPAGGASYSTKNLTVESGKDAAGAPVLTIKMAEKPTFTSVTTGNTSISDGGLTVGGNTYATPTGLNANGNPIKNVGDAVDPGDAVNKGQFDALNNAQVTVSAMDKSGYAAGGQYSFALKDGGRIGLKGDDNIIVTADKTAQTLGLKLADKVKLGAVTVNGTDGVVTGLANKDLKAPTFATMGRAATEEQLKAVAESATTLINDAGLEFLGNNSSTTRLVKLGSRLTIKGADVPATGGFSEKNLTVVASNNATEDAPTLTVKMSKKPQFDEVIIGDSNSPDALLLKDGLGFNVDGTMKTFVSAAGLNANGKPIKGVGDAVDPTDAVNKRQFDALGAAKISVQAFDKDGKMKPGNSYDFSLKDGGTIGLMGDGNLNVSVDTNKKLLSLKLADVLTIGSGKPVTINGTDGSVKVGTTTLDGSQVTGLTNTAWNGTATTGRAATEDQLQAAVTDLSQNLTAKGRGFKGNIGEKTFDLGAMVSITGTGVGDADQFDGRNLMTIVNSNGISLQMRTKPVFNGLIVQQAEGAAGAGTRIDLSEGGISVGGTTFVSAAGLSGGGKKITDVADGAIGNGSHDAVTGNQLTDSMESVRVLVGGNATMTDGKLTSTNIGGTGQDTISDAIAAVKDSVTQVSTNAVQYDTAENSKVTLKGKEGTTLANVKAGAVSEHSMEAVNGSQLYATNQQVAANKDAIAANKTAIQNLQGEVQSQIGKPMTFKANEGKNIDRKLGEILEVYGLAKTEGTYSSANVKTVATDRGLEIQLADAPKFSGAVQAERFVSNDGKASFGGDGLTVGDGKNSKVTVDKDGLKISGGPSVTRDGIDAGGKRVSNLGKGVDENDAATVGQVRDEINKVTGGTGQSLGRIARRVDELDSRVDNVGAMAAAFAAVPPMAYDETHRTSLGIGYGYYSGKSAVALGLSHYINRDVMVRGGMAISGDEKSFQLGASFRLGSSPTVTRSDGRTVRISTTEMAALRKVNDLEDTVKHQDETINQQNETIKAQNEMMKQMMKRLDALEAGKRK